MDDFPRVNSSDFHDFEVLLTLLKSGNTSGQAVRMASEAQIGKGYFPLHVLVVIIIGFTLKRIQKAQG